MRRPNRLAARVAMLNAVAASIIFESLWTIRHHDAYATFGFDLGIFDQGVWLLSRFERPFVTVRGLNLFGDHGSFILVAVAPLFWLWDSVHALLAAQATALALAAIPVFLLARDRLENEWMATLLAVAYLINPVVIWLHFDHFHPEAFELPLGLFAFWFATRKRWWWVALCVGLMLLVKEDVPLFTIPLGLAIAVRHNRRVGLAIAGGSALWMLLTFKVFIPAFGEGQVLYTDRVLFGGIGGLLRACVTRPWSVVHAAFGPGRPWYLWQLIASTGFLALLAPGTLLLVIPALAANLLTSFGYQYQIQYHYSVLVMIVLVAGTVAGIARLERLKWRWAAVALVCISAAVTSWMWSPASYARHPMTRYDPDSPQAVAANAVLRRIPRDAAVSAHYTYVPHLTHRHEIYEFPNPWIARNWGDGTQNGKRLARADRVDYIVVPWQLGDEETNLLEELTRTDEFRLVYEAGDTSLYERTR